MSYALYRERLIELAEPILILEMRRFQRRGSALWALIGVLVIILPMAIAYCHPDPDSARIALGAGASLYLLAIMIIVPSYGARSISRERESRTFDLLAMTPMTSSRIAVQKIVSATVPMLLLIAAGLPAEMILVCSGGASALEVAAMVVALCFATLAISAWSVECSSDCGTAAVWVAYLPVACHLCSLLVMAAFVASIVLLVVSSTRAQVARVLLAGLCLLIAYGIPSAFMMERAGVFTTYMPLLAEVFVGLLFQVLALMGLKCIVENSIETWRRI